MLLLFLTAFDVPLPSYKDDLALAAWHTVNRQIEDACPPDRLTGAPICTPERLDDAIEEAERFQRNLFHDARLEYLAGLAWKHKGDDAKAEEKYRASVTLDPDRQDAWHDLGELYLSQGRYDDADKAFTEVSRLVATGKLAWIGPWRLAEVAAHRQDPDAFETHMKEALQRGFSFRQIQGLPNWQGFYADPVMRDSINKLVTVYGDPKVLETLKGPK